MSSVNSRVSSQLPTPRIITYNVNSYSHLPSSKSLVSRRNKVLVNIVALLSQCDILLIQETHSPSDSPFYDKLPTSIKVFKNPSLDPTVGGTDILVHSSFLNLFDPALHVRLSKGCAHYLTFPPKGANPHFDSPFTVVNCYLPSGSGAITERDSLLDTLAGVSFPQDGFLFAGGDWNMFLHSTDSSNPARKPTNQSSFSNFLIGHSLNEVHQPSHTFFRGTTSSRLDRFYTSFSDTDTILVKPRATIPPHPHIPGSGIKRGPSDHYPVLLLFPPPQLERYARFKIPVHIATDPRFLNEIKSKWASLPPGTTNPVRKWLRFKKIIRTTAVSFMRDSKTAVATKAGLLTQAISFFRRLRSGDITLDATLSSLPDSALRTAVSKCRGDNRFRPLADFIKEATDSYPDVSVPTTNTNPMAPIRDKVSLHFLSLDNSVTTDSIQMAKALGDHWSPVFNKVSPPRAVISSYLRGYKKKLDLSLISPLTEEVMKEIVTKTRNSATGPDGIPFQVYNLLSEIASPLLWALTSHLMSGHRANKTFNHANLFFLPKVEGCPTPDDLRPLMIGNTDTRLISNAIRSVLTPAVEALLSPIQGAKLSSLIDDNIIDMNHSFYQGRHPPGSLPP